MLKIIFTCSLHFYCLFQLDGLLSCVHMVWSTVWSLIWGQRVQEILWTCFCHGNTCPMSQYMTLLEAWQHMPISVYLHLFRFNRTKEDWQTQHPRISTKQSKESLKYLFLGWSRRLILWTQKAIQSRDHRNAMFCMTNYTNPTQKTQRMFSEKSVWCQNYREQPN